MVSIVKRICDYFDSSKLTKDLTFVSIGVIGIFISGFSATAINNSFNGELTQCYTPQCFRNLLIWFSFPLKTLTATAAIMGIAAMVHRSKQTANQINLSIKQITITTTQNIHLNYFNHLKDFKEQMNTLELNVLGSLNSHRSYKSIFPNNTPNIFSPNGTLEQVFTKFRNTIESCDKIDSITLKNNPLLFSSSTLNIRDNKDFCDLLKRHHDLLRSINEWMLSIGFKYNSKVEIILHYNEMPSNISHHFHSKGNIELPTTDSYQLLFDDITLILNKFIEVSFDDEPQDFAKLMFNLLMITTKQLKSYNMNLREWVDPISKLSGHSKFED